MSFAAASDYELLHLLRPFPTLSPPRKERMGKRRRKLSDSSLYSLSLSLLGAFSLFRDRKSSLLSASFLLLLPICKVVVGVVVVAGVPCVLCTVVCRWIYSPLPPPAHRRRAARLFPLSPPPPFFVVMSSACMHPPTDPRLGMSCAGEVFAASRRMNSRTCFAASRHPAALLFLGFLNRESDSVKGVKIHTTCASWEAAKEFSYPCDEEYLSARPVFMLRGASGTFHATSKKSKIQIRTNFTGFPERSKTKFCI